MNKRITSLTVILSLLISVLPVMNINATAQEDYTQTSREVYLHARGINPKGTYVYSDVYLDDIANIYFAIDNPNNMDNYDKSTPVTYPSIKEHIDLSVEQAISDMGNNANDLEYRAQVISKAAYRAEQIERHKKPWDDLNGYTVKIYFDTRFFEFVVSEETNTIQKINHTLPNEYIEYNPQMLEIVPDYVKPQSLQYYVRSSEVSSSGNVGCAYATIFFEGDFAPIEKDVEAWYNLCSLPLKPIKTGTTEVYIDVSRSDENSLELFAKHNKNASPTLKATAFNGGRHKINIKDSPRPKEPWANPTPIMFKNGDKITLECEDQENYNIYYKKNGETKKLYTEPIDITQTTTLEFYCVKKTDTQELNPSNTVKLKYELPPREPVLFTKDGDTYNKIPNVYTSNDTFVLYADNSDEYNGVVDAGVYIYYTFSDADAKDYKTKWTIYRAGSQIPIEKTSEIRLISVYESDTEKAVSDVVKYQLNIKPKPVTAQPQGGTFNVITPVTLNCETDNAKIYFTLDGSDPITDGIEYFDGCISISKDTQIRAVAYKDGVYGDEAVFEYECEIQSPIEAYPPSGAYEGSVDVMLYCSENTQLEYSDDNGVTWKPYNGKIPISQSKTILARKVSEPQNIYTFTYKIRPMKPVFMPQSTNFSGAGEVYIYSPSSIDDTAQNDRYSLYYTTKAGVSPTDITNPDVVKVSSVKDTITLSITQPTQIRAVVCCDGVFSDVVENTYSVDSSMLAMPTPTLAQGSYYIDEFNESYKAGFVQPPDGVDIYFSKNDGPYELYNSTTEIPLPVGNTVIKAYAIDEYNNIRSETVILTYNIYPQASQDNSYTLPFANRESGVYEEYIDGTNRIFKVTLDSNILAAGETIQYCINGGAWQSCVKGDEINLVDGSQTDVGDVLLQLRYGENDEIVSYIYEFIPPTPVISLPSGRYNKNDNKVTSFNLNASIPQDAKDNYTMYLSDKLQNDIEFSNYGLEIPVNQSNYYLAYVVNTNTNKRSKSAYEYYIIDDITSSGSIFTVEPFYVANGGTKEMMSYLLDKAECRNGISLNTRSANTIMYRYTYKNQNDDESGIKNYIEYDNSPIIVNRSMKNITIHAYLADSSGNEIENTRASFKYEFLDFGIPSPSITSGASYSSGKTYTINSRYPNDSKFVIYYTLDGTDPTVRENASVYNSGDILSLSSDTSNLRTVYYRACDDCTDPLLCTHGIYGEPGSFSFHITTISGNNSVGGSGGGSYINTSTLYTKDVFGNPEPTHISYINGYPDGSVDPEAFITREEIATVISRIISKEYNNPIIPINVSYIDVDDHGWSAAAIKSMTEKGIVTGYPGGLFKPNGYLTRAEFATMISRYINKESDFNGSFDDLSSDHWAYEHISNLCGMNLMKGYDDHTFRPEHNISRAEVMSVVNRVLGRKPLESYVLKQKFNPYTDLESDKWYYVDVLEATITHNYALNSSGYEYLWKDIK